MTAYIARRLVAVIILMFAVSVLVFLILRLIPGDPVMNLLGGQAASQQQITLLRHTLGLDLPLPMQYLKWIGGVLHGDLGFSYSQNLPVATLIGQNFPYTIQLTVAGLSISVVLGFALGVLAAVKRSQFLDSLSMGVALTGLSVPSFWLGLLLITVFAVQLHWFQVFGGTSLKGLVLPAVALGVGGAGSIARFVRSNMVETFRQQYVVTARSKGVKQFQVLTRHVLRNSIIPVLTIMGLQFGNLLSGTVVIETVFSRPGIGRLLVNSILAKDYLTVQGVVLLIAVLYALVNLAVDLLYPLIDPRIALD